MSEKVWDWACPKCGRGEYDFYCYCELEDVGSQHGQIDSDRCPDVRCDYCGWEGQFPPKKSVKPAWYDEAIAAGWTPPKF